MTQIQVIMAALKRNHYSRSATARELNMHKSTLYRMIKRVGVDLPKKDGRSDSTCPINGAIDATLSGSESQVCN